MQLLFEGGYYLSNYGNRHFVSVSHVTALTAHVQVKWLSFDLFQGQQLLKLCKGGCTAKVGVFKSLLDQGADPNMHNEVCLLL